MFKRIYLDAPNIGRLEKEYLGRAIDSGYVSTLGPLVPEFETKFAQYMGVKRAVSTQSGSAAIHMALYELGIGKDDEVIVPALTFVATANPVLYVGAKPVFVDVDLKTWNILPDELERHITKKTKAVIIVHLYGNPCNLDEINGIVKKYNIHLIEDSTESLGATYCGRHTGTFGDFGCFSFNGNKVVTTGGGGMVIGRNKEKLEHIRFLANQARDRSMPGEYYHSEIGFNYRMTNLEAALGLAQIKKVGEFLKKKRESNRIYRQELEGSGRITFQEECRGARSSFWLSCIIIEKGPGIETLRKKLMAKGVPSRRAFMPITEFPPYKKYKKGNYRNSCRIYERGLCLPSSTLNSESGIRHACRIFKEVF